MPTIRSDECCEHDEAQVFRFETEDTEWEVISYRSEPGVVILRDAVSKEEHRFIGKEEVVPLYRAIRSAFDFYRETEGGAS